MMAEVAWLFRHALVLLGIICLCIPHLAQALNGPTNIEIDGGPLGPLELSGGVDGFLYAQSGQASSEKENGGVIDEMSILLQKTTGAIQFTLLVNASKIYVLGSSTPKNATQNYFTTGPIEDAYVTFVINKNLNLSVGQIYSLEGYESSDSWGNASGAESLLYDLGNGVSRGVSANYSLGPASLQVMYGDGNDTGVFNNIQYLGTYNLNTNNSMGVFGSVALAQTGPNANYYSGYKVGGNEIFINGNVLGGYFNSTIGNLILAPEVFYEYAPANVHYHIAADDVPKQTAAFGVATFGEYDFPNSPYSIGGWLDYASSQGSSALDDDWIFGPNFKAAGFSVAPAWQHGDIYVRVTAGYNRLLQVDDGFGYGESERGKNFFITLLGAGVVF